MTEALHIYVHVPFCERKCHYCDFARVEGHGDLHARYVDALVQEIEAARAKRQNTPAPRCATVYVGGGTPSCVDARLLTRLLRAIRCSYSIDHEAEITVECNPGSLTRAWADALLGAGVNRFSLGVQSLDDAELERLGRPHNASDACAAYGLLRALGCRNISMDLIYGLPGQSWRTWRASVETITSRLRPEHVSFYALTIEPGTPFARWQRANTHGWTWPSGDDMMAWYWRASGLLAKHGYRPYEISNFAKPGFLSRHNAAYWDTQRSYRGFGAAAHSFCEIEGVKRRFRNVKDVKAYIERIERGTPVHLRSKPLTRLQALGEEVYLGLRRTDGLVLRPDHEHAFGDVIRQQIADGLLQRIEGNRIALTRRGIEIANHVMAEYV